MKIMVTGHLGLVGTETCKQLKERGHEIVGYDIMEGNDIRNYSDLFDFVNEHQPERILHLAAIARMDEAERDPLLAYDTNVNGTQNVVNVAQTFRIPLVHASTGSCYAPLKDTPPITEDFKLNGAAPYGCSKTVADLLVQKMTTPWIVLRYAHIYGPEKRHRGLIGNFVYRIKHDMEPVLYGGKQSNDFIYLKDVGLANRVALEASFDKYHHAYNVGTGEELTAEEAGQAVCDLLGYKGEIKITDPRNCDIERFYYDMTKSNNKLGFKHRYSFRDGLNDMKEVFDD